MSRFTKTIVLIVIVCIGLAAFAVSHDIKSTFVAKFLATLVFSIAYGCGSGDTYKQCCDDLHG
jgi:nitrate/nitrite transporter NarK